MRKDRIQSVLSHGRVSKKPEYVVTRMIDYHIHTPLCNHARGSMEAMVRAGIRAGLEEICFLDHLILSGRGTAHSMTPDEVPFYFQSIQVMKQRYRGQISILAGLEVDFNPDAIDRIEEITGRYDFDLIGSSVHFVNDVNVASRREAVRSGSDQDDALVAGYFETLRCMLEYTYFDMVCHLDIVRKTGRTVHHRFDSLIDDVLKAIAETGRVVEINTSGLDHPAREIYPHRRFLSKCRGYGIPVVISSDAHSPSEVGRYAQEAIALLGSSGYTEVARFSKRNRYRRSLIG